MSFRLDCTPDITFDAGHDTTHGIKIRCFQFEGKIMKRSTIETVLGAVVLLTAGVFLIFSYQTADVSSGSSGYRLTANFTNIGSLGIGDTVQMAGVSIGTVSDIELTEFFEAKVTMRIDSNIEIPQDSAAVITSASLLGGQVLSIQPGGSLESLQAGDMMTHTQPHVSLEELLGKFIYSSTGSGSGSSGGLSPGSFEITPGQRSNSLP